MALDPDAPVVVSDSLAVADLGDEAVLLDPTSGKYFGLNEVAARVVSLTAETTTASQVIDQLLGEFEVDRGRLTNDVVSFLEDLQRRGLLVRRLAVSFGSEKQRVGHAVRTVRSLSGAQWGALARAAAWVPLTRVALLAVPWRRLSAAFEAAPVRHSGAPDWERARAAVWAVEAVSRRALRDRPCLTQALVARHLLRRRGVETTLEIGAVRDGEGDVVAHAWLERNGRVVLGGEGSPSAYVRFRPAARRPAANDSLDQVRP